MNTDYVLYRFFFLQDISSCNKTAWRHLWKIKINLYDGSYDTLNLCSFRLSTGLFASLFSSRVLNMLLMCITNLHLISQIVLIQLRLMAREDRPHRVIPTDFEWLKASKENMMFHGWVISSSQSEFVEDLTLNHYELIIDFQRMWTDIFLASNFAPWGETFLIRLGQSKIPCTWPTRHLSLKRGTLFDFLRCGFRHGAAVGKWRRRTQLVSSIVSLLSRIDAVWNERLDFESMDSFPVFEYVWTFSTWSKWWCYVPFSLKILTTMRSWSQEMRRLTRWVGLTRMDRTRLMMSCAGTKVVVQFVAMMSLGSKSRSAIEQMVYQVYQMFVRCLEFTMIRRWPRAILWNFLVLSSIACEEVSVHVDVIFEKGVSSNARKSGVADSMKESGNICFDFIEVLSAAVVSTIYSYCCFKKSGYERICRTSSPAIFGPPNRMVLTSFDLKCWDPKPCLPWIVSEKNEIEQRICKVLMKFG